MQVQNFECQIAKAQIGRFVAGDRLSEEAMEQLEAHISKCPACKQNLAERRAVLQAMLPTASPTQSGTESRPTRKFDLAEFVKSKIQSKQPVQAAVQAAETKPSNFTKPALYSLALGAVLIAMSYASKNVGSILGPKAAVIPQAIAVPGKTDPTPPQPTTSKAPATKPIPEAGNPVAATFAKTLASATVQASETEPAPHLSGNPVKQTNHRTDPATSVSAVRSASRSHARQARRHSHKNTPRPASNSVRVYDPGN